MMEICTFAITILFLVFRVQTHNFDYRSFKDQSDGGLYNQQLNPLASLQENEKREKAEASDMEIREYQNMYGDIIDDEEEDLDDDLDDENGAGTIRSVWEVNQDRGVEKTLGKNQHLQGGDEILTDEQIAREKWDNLHANIGYNFIRPAAYHWPKHGSIVRVPYVVTSSIDSGKREAIREAVRRFASKSCIQWMEKPTTFTGYHVRFVNGAGCVSNVGYLGVGGALKNQVITLGKGCGYTGLVQHEMLHALGFFHQHNRPDRDSYIKVFWDHIKKGQEDNFKKQVAEAVDTRGHPYDVNSIMHYGSNYMGKRGWFGLGSKKTTMLKKDGGYIKANRKAMTAVDVLLLNHMYRCNGVKAA